MASTQRDGYRLGDIIVSIPDMFYEDHPELTYKNPVASFLVLTDFLPDGWMRGRFSRGQGLQTVFDVHISSVRGKLKEDA